MVPYRFRSAIFLAPIIGLFAVAAARATVWQVGPGRTYTAPSQVSQRVADNDTVDIDAGIYPADVARWTANNLLLRGVGGYAHLKANGAAYGSKAIWVIVGNNTTVRDIEFSLCAVPDNNGAGIRQEGANLLVEHCYFHDNQEGILAGDNANSDIVIRYTEFWHNGAGDGLSHNLYINHVRSLRFEYNYSHGAIIGHELKSRAHATFILYNRIANEAAGTASREIDLPNGGTVVIMGNEIEQGPKSENSNIIGYGMEGLSNPTPHLLLIASNTIVNDRGAGSFIAIRSADTLGLYNNIMAGPGTLLSGSPTVMDSMANIVGPIASAGLQDAAGYNYALAPTSPARYAGVDPGLRGGLPMLPDREYTHPVAGAARVAHAPLSIGAHEFAPALGMPQQATANSAVLSVVPQPLISGSVVRCPAAPEGSTLTMYDMVGHVAWHGEISGTREAHLAGVDWPTGVYLLRVVTPDGSLLATQCCTVR